MPTARLFLWRSLLLRSLALAALLTPAIAQASLGGAAASVSVDSARMAARSHAIAASATHTQHTLTLANGGVVKEYVNTSGTIYAVSWNGPGKPDLAQVLGTHFAAFQADNSGPRLRGVRRAPFVNRSDLKVVTGGHPGSFWGVAWLPGSVPAGFDPNAL